MHILRVKFAELGSEFVFSTRSVAQVVRSMQTSSSKQVIGCIGKCTTGLSRDELDQITDNINETLAHPRGREIFRKYLKRRDLEDSLECLNLYETCCYSIDDAKRCP